MKTEYLTLLQLNSLVEDSVRGLFPETYWVVAETSDVRVNHANGHCYLEFIEKNEQTSAIAAKARGYIWNSVFRMLNPYFEEVTGRKFTSGLKILVRVSVDFHPVYGYGLNVCDIEPTYTLGDMQLRRKEIISRLEEDGVLTLNKELELSETPQRIAVITSPTAAGYEDFLEHLHANRPGFVFYPKLFPAVMQGDQTESSVLSALERIYNHREMFDAVVVIRGGGAASDLAAFDSYLLAAACAQFPLPVITGIGHERDDTVLDLVAYHRAKTPTAVADYLIHCLEEAWDEFLEIEYRIRTSSTRILDEASVDIKNLIHLLNVRSLSFFEKEGANLNLIRSNIRNTVSNYLVFHQRCLDEKQAFIRMSSPEYILGKGYSITRKNGKAVKSSQEVVEGDVLETIFLDGKISSKVR